MIDAVELEGLEHVHYIETFIQDGTKTQIYKFNEDLTNKNAQSLYMYSWHNADNGKNGAWSMNRPAFYYLGMELGISSQLPERSISEWWVDETMGKKEFRDYPSPVNVDMEGTDGLMPLLPEDAGTLDGNQDPSIGKPKPSLIDRYIGKDFDEVQQGDTFWLSKPDRAGGSYPMPARKDSTKEYGYGTVRTPDSKDPTDYTKVKSSTLPR